MSQPPVITLTTDFGTRDPYAAAMKGVILRACPAAQIHDLSHDIAPHDILEAAYFVAAAAPAFPPGTRHIVVVDPGVGGVRKPIAAAAGGQVFIGPDNGFLSVYLDAHPLEKARIIENPRFMRTPAAPTFHGRDIFAPAAGALAAGAPWRELGAPLDQISRIRLPAAEFAENEVRGEVVHIDRFGNCVTNIPAAALTPGAKAAVRCADLTLPLTETYETLPKGQPLALTGSSGHIELAVNQGSAHKTLGINRGARVSLILKPG